MKLHPLAVLIFVLLAASLLVSCTSAGTPVSSSNSPTGSTLDGQTLMQERCSVCHSAQRITTAHKTPDEWKTTTDRMVRNGAKLTIQEVQILVDYLGKMYK